MPVYMGGFVVSSRVGNCEGLGNAFLGVFRPKAHDMGLTQRDRHHILGRENNMELRNS